MAFRNAATVVVALVFKLLDTSGFTRFLLAAKTRLGFAGYAIVYDDPDFENANTEAGLWATGIASGAGPGTDVAQIQLYADITNIVNLMGYVEALVIESLQESGVTLMCLAPGGEQASITLSARNGGTSEIAIVCERLGAWTAFPFGANFGNFSPPFQVCQYRKVGDIVQVRGTAITTGATGANPTIGTLPVGFRLPVATEFPIIVNALFGFVQVASTGAIILATPGLAAGIGLSINIQYMVST